MGTVSAPAMAGVSGGPPTGLAQPAYAQRPPAAAAKPKKKWVLPVALLLVGALLVSLLTGAFAWWQTRPDPLALEYQTLRSTICRATSPEEVLAHSARLEAFNAQNPQYVDADLLTLVKGCETFAAAQANDRKFLQMEAQLGVLETSQVPEIAQCAGAVLDTVLDEDESFKAAAKQADEENNAAREAALAQMEEERQTVDGLPIQPDYADFMVDVDSQGNDIFSFTCTNVTQMTVAYFEVWVFCYDAEGNAVTGADGTNVEWVSDGGNIIAPDETLDKDSGHWRFTNCKNVAIIVPFIIYVEFEDGEPWGVTNDSMTLDEELLPLVDALRPDMDMIAALLAQGAI